MNFAVTAIGYQCHVIVKQFSDGTNSAAWSVGGILAGQPRSLGPAVRPLQYSGSIQHVAVHAGGTGLPMRLKSSGSMGSATSIGSESLFFSEGPRQSSLGTTLAAMELRELELHHHNLRSQQQQQQQQQQLQQQNMLRGASMPVLSLGEAKSPRAISCARQVSRGDTACLPSPELVMATAVKLNDAMLCDENAGINGRVSDASVACRSLRTSCC